MVYGQVWNLRAHSFVQGFVVESEFLCNSSSKDAVCIIVDLPKADTIDWNWYCMMNIVFVVYWLNTSWVSSRITSSPTSSMHSPTGISSSCRPSSTYYISKTNEFRIACSFSMYSFFWDYCNEWKWMSRPGLLLCMNLTRGFLFAWLSKMED